MASGSNHTLPAAVNSNVLSARDEALRNSSPIAILVMSVFIIFTSIFFVFLAWARNRRTKNLSDVKNDLIPNSEFQISDNFEPPRDTRWQQSQSGRPLKLGIRTSSKPEFVICTDSESEEPANDSERPHSSENIIRVLSQSKSRVLYSPHDTITESVINVNASANLCVDSLKAAHKRQFEQRERFIHDINNTGLRHLAMSQIINQQATEKLIMKTRLSGII
jgi:hypothetical protein